MALLAAILACPTYAQPAYNIETVAGSSSGSGIGGPATAAQLGSVQGVATGSFGNLYLSDTTNNRILKVDTSGIITIFAGTGTAGFTGDGGPATAAELDLPYGLALDVAGNLYVADYGNNVVRRIAPDGTISTVAGGGMQADASEGSPATSIPLLGPRNLVFDAAENLYISEFNGARVRRVDPSGNVWTVAGTGVAGSNDETGSGAYAQLSYPAGLAVDGSGNLYIADTGVVHIETVASEVAIIRKVQLATGIMSSVPVPQSLQFSPVALAVDSNATLYASDGAGVLSYTQAGVWSAFAGVLSLPAGSTLATFIQGYSGDGGLATSAELTGVQDLALSPAGTFYIADSTRVRSVDVSRIMHTVAGSGPQGEQEAGDGGPATSAVLNNPSAVALDYSGNLFIADKGFHRIRQVASSGTITTAAGTGIAGYNGDGKPAGAAELSSPSGVSVDARGSLVIADTYNQRIRKVTGGVIATAVGTGSSGNSTQNTQPLQTPVQYPSGVCFDLGGNQYVVDRGANKVLQVPPGGGLVVIFAGQSDGTPGSGAAGDGGLARAAHLNAPTACATDSGGNVYIADTGNNRIRMVTAAGIISTVAGTGSPGVPGQGDEGPATAAALSSPTGVAVDGSGNMFLSDSANHRIRMVTTDGVMHSIAGTGAPGLAGDGGSAQIAQFFNPSGIVVDGSGNLYVADMGNNRIRRLAPQVAQPVTAPISPVVTPTQPASAPTLAIENAASMAQGAVAPGELVTLVGSGLGPESGVGGLLNSAGLVGQLVSGTEVEFDGVLAPVFSAQYSQVTVQVPYSVAGNTVTNIVVLYLGQTAGTASVAVANAAPGLYTQVLNQDGSINSPGNPAPRGSTMVFSATGEGLRNDANVTGLPAAAPYASPLQPVSLTIGAAVASIAYASAAPGQVGVLQVNAVAPNGPPGGPAAVVLTVGAASSVPIVVWLQ